MIAVQKSCIHASAVAVFVEWWIVVFVDNVSFHRGICTLGASFCAGDAAFMVVVLCITVIILSLFSQMANSKHFG